MQIIERNCMSNTGCLFVPESLASFSVYWLNQEHLGSLITCACHEVCCKCTFGFFPGRPVCPSFLSFTFLNSTGVSLPWSLAILGHRDFFGKSLSDSEPYLSLFWNESESRSIVSNSLQPRVLHSPRNSLGQNTGLASLSLLQVIFPTQGWNPGLPHCRWILYYLSHKGSPPQSLCFRRH